MHIKPSQAHLSAPGKDEFDFLQSMIWSKHCYSLSTCYLNNAIAYHNENRSVNTQDKETILTSILAHWNRSACSFSDEFPLVIGYCHLRDTNPTATPKHPAFSGEFITHLGTSD